MAKQLSATSPSLPRAPPGTEEVVSDYHGFDFRSLWAGRGHVTAFEQALVGRLLAATDLRRVIEVGTGFGRLSGVIAAAAGEYVGVDYDPELLLAAGEAARSARVGRTVPRMALMNAYHPAFVPGAFSAIVMVRLYHHFAEPGAVLTRWGRTLGPTGRLLVSYNPRPSIGTLVIDVKSRLRRPAGRPGSLVTWSRTERVEIPEGTRRTYVAPRRDFERATRVARLRTLQEFGGGLEEYLRRIPVRVLLRLSYGWPRGVGFPTRFAALAPVDPPVAALPPLDRIWACPRCSAPLLAPESRPGTPPSCSSCGWVGGQVQGLPDYRYSPESEDTPSPARER